MNIESITATQYDRAIQNGADRPQFKELSKELERIPETRQRLAFEFLDLASHCVRSCEEPARFLGLAAAFYDSVEGERRQEFSSQVESTLMKYFDTLPNGATPSAVTLSMGFLAIGKFSKEKLLALLNNLMSQCSGSDPRRDVIVRAKQILSQRRRPTGTSGDQP